MSVKFLETNVLIRSVCRETEGVEYIDVWNRVIDKNTGRPRPGLFAEDRVHLAPEG